MAAKGVVLEIGQKFGFLTVEGRSDKRYGRQLLWKLRCECGAEVHTRVCDLKTTKHCGCRTGLKHGQAKLATGKRTPMYVRWLNMKGRCSSIKADHAGRYLARGIKVCDRWANSFIDFNNDILAEIGECPSRKHQLDRKDNNGNYEPGNVRWATREEQQRNTARNHLITYAGKTMCLSDWADELGIPRPRLSRRIHLGWTIDKAFSA